MPSGWQMHSIGPWRRLRGSAHALHPGPFRVRLLVLSSEYATPDALETSFAASPDVSRRGAMAAAVLAPDGISEGGDVLSRFFSSLQERVGSDGVVGLMDGVLDLWGKLLVSYGDAGWGLEEAFGRSFIRGLDSQGLGSVGSWLGDRLTGVVRALDMQPVDMRPRKPVLVDSLERARTLRCAGPGGWSGRIARAVGRSISISKEWHGLLAMTWGSG